MKKRILVTGGAGFKITRCAYFDFLGYFATFAYKYIDNSGVINENSIKIYDKAIFPVSNFIDKLTFGNVIGKNLILEASK